jgi:hypothetical protein
MLCVTLLASGGMSQEKVLCKVNGLLHVKHVFVYGRPFFDLNEL